jgi:hypothetical protein
MWLIVDPSIGLSSQAKNWHFSKGGVAILGKMVGEGPSSRA